MKKKRFSEEQIVRILRQAEEADKTATEVCKEHGVSQQTFYRWKKKFGQMNVPDVRRLRELEKENARLKRIVAAAMPRRPWVLPHQGKFHAGAEASTACLAQVGILRSMP